MVKRLIRRMKATLLSYNANCSEFRAVRLWHGHFSSLGNSKLHVLRKL